MITIVGHIKKGQTFFKWTIHGLFSVNISIDKHQYNITTNVLGFDLTTS